jgi:hypothetical protein
MPDKTKSVIIRDFPVDLHAAFKSLCALVPVSMNRKIIEMVSAFIDEHHEVNQRVRQFNKK